MFESFMKLDRRFLQSHGCLKTIRIPGSLADETVNFLFNIDQRLFHDIRRVGRSLSQCKRWGLAGLGGGASLRALRSDGMSETD